MIKLSANQLLVADACIAQTIQADQCFDASSAGTSQDEVFYAYYMAARALGDNPCAALIQLLAIDPKDYPQLQACDPYRQAFRPQITL